MASDSLPAPLSGRLLVLVRRKTVGAAPSAALDANPFAPGDIWVAGREVAAATPGETLRIETAGAGFPAPLSALPPGDYEIQALLDPDHSYVRGGRGPGDVVSPVTAFTLPGPPPRLVLDRVIPAPDPGQALAGLTGQTRVDYARALAELQPVDLPSPSVSAFWHRPMRVRGWVALPPGYDPRARLRYPTVYVFGGFGSSLASLRDVAASAAYRMRKGVMPPIIWVALDHATPAGYHEFLDSANNGPWGRALTTEVIPALERRYRMIGGARGRFLTGHSSGGWASLWLQVRYPELFGGAWATSPDAVDFHHFARSDLYADANLFAGPGGEPRPLIRDKGRVLSSAREFVQLEQVLGPRGGQMASLEWAFSPRAPGGGPAPLFDRRTGAIDPAVARHWRENYDIAARITREWPSRRRVMDGKIHLIVGDADTFFLNESALGLRTVLDRLGARASVRVLPGKTHFDLYERGGDYNALRNDIAWEIYRTARPDCAQPKTGCAERP